MKSCVTGQSREESLNKPKSNHPEGSAVSVWCPWSQTCHMPKDKAKNMRKKEKELKNRL